jgi:hypothetical protein
MTCELVGVLAGRKYEGPFHPRCDTGVIQEETNGDAASHYQHVR